MIQKTIFDTENDFPFFISNNFDFVENNHDL